MGTGAYRYRHVPTGANEEEELSYRIFVSIGPLFVQMWRRNGVQYMDESLDTYFLVRAPL